MNCGELVKEEDTEIIQCSTCKTSEHLHLLDENSLTDGYIPSDEYDYLFEPDQTEVIDNSNYITCATCSNKFHLPDDDAICPFCYSLVEQVTLLEDAAESQMKKDSGALLDPEVEEANDAILEAARKADEIIERIPEPGSSSIPIPEQAIEPEGKATLLNLFKRVFGEKK
jgi:Zn finger protein HypA/HybF involved in hydrogenase expression